MRKIARWALVAIAVGLTALAVTRYRSANSEAERWNALTAERKVNVVSRSLPSFEALLKRQAGWEIDLLSERYYGGYKENYADDMGLLVEKGRLAGYCHSQFFFHGWDAQPASAELRISLKPWIVEKLPKTEFKLLVDQTRKDGQLRTRMGDVDWFSQVDDKGQIAVNLRLQYPSRWVEDIPQFDRGFSDRLRFEIVPKVAKFLYSEVLIDPYTPMSLESPSFNPPDHAITEPVGRVEGYFRTKDDHLVPFVIETTSTTSFPRQVTVHVAIGEESGTNDSGKVSTPQNDLLSILKPPLAQLDAKPDFSGYRRGELSITYTPPRSMSRLSIDFPLDYPLEDAHLSQMVLTP